MVGMSFVHRPVVLCHLHVNPQAGTLQKNAQDSGCLSHGLGINEYDTRKQIKHLLVF